MDRDPIKSLIHLSEDGAFNRRELISRLTRYTGTAAAAIAAVVGAPGLARPKYRQDAPPASVFPRTIPVLCRKRFLFMERVGDCSCTSLSQMTTQPFGGLQ